MRIVDVEKFDGVHTTLRFGVVRTVHVPKPNAVHTTLLSFVVRTGDVAKPDGVFHGLCGINKLLYMYKQLPSNGKAEISTPTAPTFSNRF